MSEKGVYRYMITQRDADFTDLCTHTSLMNHILQAAGDDADSNGFGIKDLNVGNCSWVLSRMCAEFAARPAHGEPITVRTWISDVGRLMTTRCMTVTDDRGERIAGAVTQWAVIDIETRRAVDIRSNVDYRGNPDAEPLPCEPPARIPRIDNTPDATKKVLYSDIDFNRHMNAMKYIEWVIDNAPIEAVSSGALRRIDVNFIKEALLGQDLAMHISREELSDRYEIRELSSGDALCRCALTYDGR